MEYLIASSRSGDRGSEHIEYPPIMSVPGIKKSTHCPGLKVSCCLGTGASLRSFTVGEISVIELTVQSRRPGSLLLPLVRSM